MLPPAARPQNAVDTIPAKHLHSSLNRIKHPINVVRWTPEGRRCLTCSSDGEFTLWNGMAFNFETILRVSGQHLIYMYMTKTVQAHDSAIRAAVYSHSEEWLISADHDGIVKFWQTNFNNVRNVQAHSEPIRDLAFSPNDEKYVTACDDATLKIYNFAADKAESTLTGHNWEVKSADWHPSKGLLVSGSKDHQVKLWDPRNGRCLTTLHGHKNTISKTLFEKHRGVLLATCARDQTARVFDLRMMRDVCLLKGHEKDVSTLTWHPIHPHLLSTGGSDGAIFHYLLDEPNTPPGAPATISPYDSPDPSNTPAQAVYPAHKLQHAHDFAVWSLCWHPLGHILASGSNDRVTRFWTRPRPGETECFNDRYHLGEAAAEAQGTWDRRGGRREMREAEAQEEEDEADGLVDQTMPATGLPGLPGLAANAGKTSMDPIGLAPVPDSSLPFPIPPPPPNFAGMDPTRFAQLLAEGKIMPPPPPMGQGAIPPPPPNFDFSKIPPEILAKFPGGIPPPPLPVGGAPIGLPGMDGGGGGAGSASVRKRAPLPSQQESLKEEQKRGNFRIAR